MLKRLSFFEIRWLIVEIRLKEVNKTLRALQPNIY